MVAILSGPDPMCLYYHLPLEGGKNIIVDLTSTSRSGSALPFYLKSSANSHTDFKCSFDIANSGAWKFNNTSIWGSSCTLEISNGCSIARPEQMWKVCIFGCSGRGSPVPVYVGLGWGMITIIYGVSNVLVTESSQHDIVSVTCKCYQQETSTKIGDPQKDLGVCLLGSAKQKVATG